MPWGTTRRPCTAINTCAMASGVLLSSSILRYRSVTFFSLSILRSHCPSSVRCRAISLSYRPSGRGSARARGGGAEARVWSSSSSSRCALVVFPSAACDEIRPRQHPGPGGGRARFSPGVPTHQNHPQNIVKPITLQDEGPCLPFAVGARTANIRALKRGLAFGLERSVQGAGGGGIGGKRCDPTGNDRWVDGRRSLGMGQGR